MTQMMIWTAVGLLVGLYCLIRGVVDLRQKRYVWAAAGFVSATLILLTPIRTHAVKVDLPISR